MTITIAPVCAQHEPFQSSIVSHFFQHFDQRLWEIPR
jgi:hypothetical protein